MKRVVIAMVVFCLGLGGIGYAEEGQKTGQPAPEKVVKAEQKAPEQTAKPEKTMPEIVVTATKTKQEASKTPTKVEVVKGEQIKDTNVTTADQSLKGTPGVFSSRPDGPKGLTDPRYGVTLRGLPNQSRTMVLLDGQKLNNYEGTTFWWTIPTESIKRIEVVKGGISSLYGGGAMGGVINIITKTEDVPLYFSLGMGSYDLTDMSIGSSARMGDFAYHIMYNKKGTGGIEQLHRYSGNGTPAGVEVIPTATGSTEKIDGYNSWVTTIDALEMGCDWDMSTDSTIGLKAGYASYAWVPETSYNVLGTDITGTLRENQTRHLNLVYENVLNKYADLKFNIGVLDNYQDLYQGSPTAGESNCPNSAYSTGLQSNITLPWRNTLTIGMDGSRARMVSEDYGSLTSPQFTKGKMVSYGVFLQDEFKATDFLILYAGVRYDYWKAFDASNNSPDAGTNTGDKSRSHVSPKGSIVILPDDKTTIRGSVSESFRAPVLNEMFSSRYMWRGSNLTKTLPNLDLKPETALSYEGNIERIFFDRLTLGATYFSIHLDDMIYQVSTTAGTVTDKQNQNIAEAYSKGYELSISYKVIEGLTLFANQTHTDTRITKDTRTTQNREGKQFAKTPQDIYNYGCSMEYARFFGNVLIKSISDQYYEDANTDIYDHAYGGYDSYTTADATVGYKFLKNCSLSVSVNNIGDKEYWEGYDKNPGRTYLAKGTLSF